MRNLILAVVYAHWIASGSSALAAHFTTSIQQAGGQNWNGAIWQPGGVAPTPGNTYEVVLGGSNPARIRNPVAGGIQTFPGDSLQLDVSTEIRAKIPVVALDFPGVGGMPGLIMNGGNLDTGDNAVFTVTGFMVVQVPSSFTCGDAAANDARGWIVAAQIKGGADLTITKNFATGPAAVELTGANNPYTGGWILNGGYFKATAPGSLGSGNVTLNPGAAGAIFEPMYDSVSAGTLSISAGNVIVRLHQNISFVVVTIDGNALSDGTYDYELLSIAYPDHFPVGAGSGNILVQPVPPPPAPANLTALNGDAQVTLSWSAASTATSYNVKRAGTSGGPYTTVGTPAGTSFVDLGLVNGDTYYYVVSAVNGGGESPNSSEAIGRPNNIVTGVTAVGGNGQVTVAWNAYPGALSYSVKRAGNSGGPYADVATGVVGTSYLDTTVQSGRNYFYVIVAALAGGSQSGISAEATATTAPGVSTLVARLFAATTIILNWTNSDPIVSNFVLEHSSDGVNFAPLVTVPGTQKSYIDSGLTANTTYSYRVQAQNATGVAAFSNPASTSTPASGVNVNFAAGAGNSAGNPVAPVPPGYVQDIGDIFGDRSNGYFYGWDRSVVPDGRYRQAVNSPDLRYDTFMHLIKAIPPAVWEVELPNGYYWVHIVGGDPANTDSVFQFDIEGVITPTVTAGSAGSVFNNWCDFVKTASVEDGRLTIRSGPNSQTTVNNNKIGFIDIYPAVALAVGIDLQPQSYDVLENRPVELSISVTNFPPPPNTPFYGSDPVSYQWYFNGPASIPGQFDPVTGATSPTLTLLAKTSDAGSYYVVASNPAGMATSQVATVTVRVDNAPPQIVSVGSVDGSTIGVCYDELVDPTPDGTALFFGSYHINNDTVSVVAVALRPDGKSVVLTVSPPVTGSFTVGAEASDLKGNPGTQSGTGQVMGYISQDIGAPGLAGSSVSCDGETIEIVGGGADIWGNSDQFQFVYKEVTGDFDASVRVNSLRGGDPITKAVLDVREAADAAAAALHISVNPPPPGRDLGEAGQRSTLSGTTAAWPGSLTYTPVGIPNAWIRMTRVGQAFTAFHSSNGTDWIQFAQVTQASPASLLVGIGVTAHNNTLLATGAFSNFRILGPCERPIVSGMSYVGGTFSFQVSSQPGCNYVVEFKNNLEDANWITLTSFAGTGSLVGVSDQSGAEHKFYRVRTGSP